MKKILSMILAVVLLAGALSVEAGAALKPVYAVDENNKVNTTKAVQAEIDSQYSNFDCSISFGANTGVDLDLVICAYVITDDGVTFIQKDSGSDVTIGASTFKSVTLASVVALVPTVSKEN